ncbi:MAG: hypothetical protein E7490_04695 [Ruminococcaceae bacterium]|nr:hypothetical protein [Oscillospiraceae bacterium]
MKYISINRLCDFEFHDAKFTLLSVDKDLSVKAEFLNIHKDAKQNPYKTDMEIETAEIIFKNFSVQSYETGKAMKQNEKGELYQDEEQIILTEFQAYNRFIDQLKSKTIVFDLGVYEEDIYYIDGIAQDPFFSAFFKFDSVTIWWDKYKKEAWYIARKH